MAGQVLCNFGAECRQGSRVPKGTEPGIKLKLDKFEFPQEILNPGYPRYCILLTCNTFETPFFTLDVFLDILRYARCPPGGGLASHMLLDGAEQG